MQFSPEVLAKALQNIYKGFDVKKKIEKNIFWETLRLFNEAAAKGFSESEWDDTPDEFINQVRTNNKIWSAFRTHRMQNDLASKLLDENGQLKKFDKWVEDIKGMTNHYVGSWLRTEYNTAVIRAHQAADWKHFEQEADVFPNLRWMPTTSPLEDPKHRQYWEAKLTLPINHPFWEDHHPGDRWNCKCRLKQTDEPVNDYVIKDFYPVVPQAGLDNNPGVDGKLFNDTHPYFKSDCKVCPFYVKKKIYVFKGSRKDCYLCKNIISYLNDNKSEPPFSDDYITTNNKNVLISPYHGANELEDNLRIANFLSSKLKSKIYLLPRINSNTDEQLNLRNRLIPKGVASRKNPDFLIGKNIFEAKSMLEVTSVIDDKAIKEAIFNRIKKAKKQADNIILEISGNIERKQIYRYINGYLKQSKKKRIIIVKWKNKLISFTNKKEE